MREITAMAMNKKMLRLFAADISEDLSSSGYNGKLIHHDARQCNNESSRDKENGGGHLIEHDSENRLSMVDRKVVDYRSSRFQPTNAAVTHQAFA
uniref:Uncharacterized protein n=1 Tax=Pristionchus pacificus TaxID=54126 RepID=A0A2A6BWS7_PRIPA|eukprot:PDM70296.1 hypothetical protein PRIPAC_46542 [Pristionchus pacificus]